MTSPYGAIGAKLVERGYAALPVIPGTKRPGEYRKGVWTGKNNWREEYTRRLPSRFEISIWSSAPDGGVGVVCGPASRNLVALDIDTDRTDIRTALLAILPATTLIKQGAKGETRFYRGSEIVPMADGGTLSPSWNIGDQRVADFIGPGRQTVLPPSIHPDTNAPYRWIGPDALEDTDPDDIPELPADILDQISAALVPFGYATELQRSPVSSSDAESPFRRLNDLAYGDVSAWVPALMLERCRAIRGGFEAVAHWRRSTTGRDMSVRKYNLKITEKGAVDFGDGPKSYTAINLVAAAMACDDDTAVKWLSDHLGRSVDTSGLVPRQEPAEPVSNVIPFPAVSLAPLTAKPTSDDGERDVHPLEALTRCPGLVGELVDWICDASLRPSRVLAMGTAITVIGTLLGRRVCGPTESATHLYVVGLAPTAAGKEWPLNCCGRLLEAAGAGSHEGASKFKSSSAVINALVAKPLALSAQDEFGSILKRINGRKASTHEKEISEIYRTAWGKSFESMGTSEWAGRKEEKIYAPAFSIYGMSTPDEFFDSLTGQEVENGFLNRFLVFPPVERPAEQRPKIGKGVPPHLRDKLCQLFLWGSNELALGCLGNSCLNPTAQKMDFEPSGAARSVYDEYVLKTLEQMDREKEMAPFLGRASETAIRLATIRAAGRWGHKATIDPTDMEWGRDVSAICFQSLGREASKKMIIERSHGQVYNRILDILAEAGGRVPEQRIYKSLGKSVKSRKDMQSTIEMMLRAGDVLEEKKTPLAGGPPTIWYKLGG